MKALSTTILIVVTAVVILVAALVVLTIFGGGISNVAEITNQKNNCITQCTMTCQTMNAMPPTWSASGCGQFTDINPETICHCCPSGKVWCSTQCKAPPC